LTKKYQKLYLQEAAQKQLEIHFELFEILGIKREYKFAK